jgi:hypothetical protein
VQRLVHHAVLSLLAFSALTTLALAAWFYRAGDPWSWRTIVAVLCDALALATAALLFRARGRAVGHARSRAHVLLGGAVMLLSLVRVSGAWTIASGVLVAITLVLLVPLARAALALGADP